MKVKLKTLVAAFALAIGGQAQAAIDSDNAANAGTGTGVGELFLSVIDRGGSAPRSYVRDLGITAADFLANDASFVNNLSIAADANLLDILNNATGTIAWNLAAAYNDWGTNLDTLGYLTTSPIQLDVNNTPSGFAGIGGTAIPNIGIYLQSVNGVDANYAADGSQIFGNAANAFMTTPGVTCGMFPTLRKPRLINCWVSITWCWMATRIRPVCRTCLAIGSCPRPAS